jgi:hypothetical protein
MLRCVVPAPPACARTLAWLCLLACLIALAGCGGGTSRHAHVQRNPSRYYPPPGPAGDPWGPYIHEASGRFGIPELWIRRVMRQESGGQEDVISWAGAMGLMQVMPDTYADLRGRYALGDDPFDPHNNILAGTAYLREMYDRYGAPGFLAAYNAGPNRLDSYLNNGRPLPDETVNYVASIAPLLGPGTPLSGPLAVYASPVSRYAAARPTPAGCDPDAAYNPDGPCTRRQPVVVAAAAPVYDAPYQSGACDADAAYDPNRPCHPPPAATVSTVTYTPTPASCDPDDAYDPTQRCRPAPAAPAPAPVVAQALAPPELLPPALRQSPRPTRYAMEGRPLQERIGQPAAFIPGPPPGHWAIQVGAFANLATAEQAAETARSGAPDLLRTAKIELPPTTPFGTQVAFRARLAGLSQTAAASACSRLSARGTACITVPPSGNSF